MTAVKARRARGLEFLWMTAPAVIVILLFVEIPFLMSITYSFTRWNGLDKAAKLIGLANYRELLVGDPAFGSALVFTLIFTLLAVVAINVIALLLAVILDMKIRGRNLLRAAFYIPNIISLIVIGYVWRFIFSRGFDSLGAITHLGVFQLSWLGDSHLAFFSVALVSVWQSIGFYLVIYIAGLQTVPRELLEAAIIDGTSPVSRFFRVTLPLIMPSVTVAVLLLCFQCPELGCKDRILRFAQDDNDVLLRMTKKDTQNDKRQSFSAPLLTFVFFEDTILLAPAGRQCQLIVF